MTDRADSTKKRYEKALIQTEVLYQTPRISSLLSTIKFDDGKTQHHLSLSHLGAVAIVAQDHDAVYLVRQYRQTVNQITLELPAGLIDQTETKEEAAIRELQEEIGKKPNTLFFIQTILTSPGILQEEIHLFYACNLQDGYLYAEDTQEIDIVKIPLNVALSSEFISKLSDAKTIIGLNWLKNHVKNNL